jgi:hypothetical protein
VKRACRKIAKATAAAARAGGPPFGASITGLRELRKATLAHHRLVDLIANLGEVKPRNGYIERAVYRARAEGVVP